jgi:hypothetical protein
MTLFRHVGCRYSWHNMRHSIRSMHQENMSVMVNRYSRMDSLLFWMSHWRHWQMSSSGHYRNQVIVYRKEMASMLRLTHPMHRESRCVMVNQYNRMGR